MEIVFHPKDTPQMAESESTAAVVAAVDPEIAGLKDRLVEGLIGRFVDLDGIKKGDPKAIMDAATKIAGFLGFDAEAKEVIDIVKEVIENDWAGAVYELGDALMKFTADHRKAPTISIAAAPPAIAEYTRQMSQNYYADNRGPIRKESKRLLIRFWLRDAPEILDKLQGKKGVDAKAIDPERLANIIDILRTASKVLTLFSAAFPAILPIVAVLKLIVAWYDANHPADGSAVVNGDRGLSVEDL